MRRNSIIVVFALLALLQVSCIKRFDPELDSNDVVKFVVTGQVSQGEAVQRISVSTASSVAKPMHIPVTGCTVTIIDGKGNSYPAADMYDGNYEAIIPESELLPGASFMVDIMVPGGGHIVSDFDQINECPELTSLYYLLDSLPSTNPFLVIRGIQFYTDLDAENMDSHYFRWELIETWEHKARLAASISTKKICWTTATVNNFFTLSTEYLSVNKYKQFRLHFVDNISTPRLSFGYSLLVRQYSLSSTAYKYWEEIRKNNNAQGGLYESQPRIIKGNLHNLTYPDKLVLGYFGACSVRSKRIFVKNIPGLIPQYIDCEPELDPKVKPDPRCFNCLLTGGTTVKPDFWPN